MYKQFKIVMLFFVGLSGLLFVALCNGEESEYKNLISDIDKYSVEVESGWELRQSIIDQIEKEGGKVSSLLIGKINEPNMPEKTLAVYVWAIGFTKDPNTISNLINIYEKNPSKIVQWNALRSLAKIGNPEAGDYLLSVAKITQDSNKDKDELTKYEIISLLAEMQYDKALPEMEVILKKDPRQYYWQSWFCFGTMGDKSISYLLKKINDPDKNVRINSMAVLGVILIATEAAKPLGARYWIEEDPEIKMLILASLSVIEPNMAESRSFLEEVATKEQNEKLKNYAKKIIDNLKFIKQEANKFKAKKKNDRQCFEKEYALLYKSAGRQGDIETLGSCSISEDEPRLKDLRRQILITRNSDEGLYDCRKVNEIIMMNRRISQNKNISVQGEN